MVNQPPHQAVNIQSLKAKLVSYLKHLQVNLRSGNNATNLHQTGQYLLHNIKKTTVKIECPRVIQVNKRKKLFGMETVCYSKYCISGFCLAFFCLNYLQSPFLKRGLNASQLHGPDDTY